MLLGALVESTRVQGMEHSRRLQVLVHRRSTGHTQIIFEAIELRSPSGAPSRGSQ